MEKETGVEKKKDRRRAEGKAAERKAGSVADHAGNRAEQPLGEVRVSVRGLVEFVLRHGDIDNRRKTAPENAMQEGSRIHRMIQRRAGSGYRAEVPLKISLEEEGYVLTVEGRADGIIHQDNTVTIDEIKGTYREPARLKEPLPEHIAQAKCYAYIYALQQNLQEVRVRMTYCHIPSEELRYFYEDHAFPELEKWFQELMASYRKWADHAWKWKELRQASIKGLPFPFPYREGQKGLVDGVYRTIYHKKKLFLEAPTGVGKTISTIYPAVHAIGQGMGDRLFYLTAKTITRTVAEDTLALLRQRGLRFKSVILTAKEKICFMEEAECNPEYCPYAKGHYDRVNEAIYDLLTSRESFSRECIEEYARRHVVCPFEMCLDMSLFADAVICDYNYLFDPHVYLKRFFGEGAGGSYLFLVDEAHNLLERGREMYSAVLWKEKFLELRRELKKTIMSEISENKAKSEVSGQLTLATTGASFVTEVSGLPEVSDVPVGGRKRGRSTLVRQGYAEKINYQLDKCNQVMLAMKRECERAGVVQDIDELVQPLVRLQAAMDDYLDEQEEERLPVRELLLDFYFEVSHFLEIYELVDENYVMYDRMCEDGDFMVKLFCVNPAENLKGCMKRGRSSILFSATFLPIQYYKKLLGGGEEDYEVYAQSMFRPEKRMLLIAEDVTSKYSRRSEKEYRNIALYIEEIVKNRHGNYMVFCPSYAFLQAVYQVYVETFAGEERECMIQGEYMSEAEREDFLGRFRGNAELDLQADIAMEIEQEDRVLIGFCVLGGIFSEGIDLKNDSLIGAIIVGTGFPQVCFERELLRSYFDEDGENGFDYAYRYPGMNKVLQAAGRVIRTVEDVGIVALLDERFLQPAYRKMFPREWSRFETVRLDTVAKRVERFWNEWL